MNKIGKFIVQAALVAGLAFASSQGYSSEKKRETIPGMQEEGVRDIERQNHLERVAQSVREAIWKLDNFGLPEIVDFSKYSEKELWDKEEDKLRKEGREIAAVYSEKDRTIFIKDHYLEDRLTVAHELGHFYIYRLKEKKKNIHNFVFPSEEVIREGIAEYFASCVGYIEDNFKDEEYPKNTGVENLTNRLKYEGGYHLVRPVIDKYGGVGIEVLLNSIPPRLDELVQFRESVMKRCEERQIFK